MAILAVVVDPARMVFLSRSMRVGCGDYNVQMRGLELSTPGLF